MTLLRKRQLMMKDIIDEMVEDFLAGMKKGFTPASRACATCGKKFNPRTRNHFFHTAECRHEFYRGQFVTRKG